MMIFLPDGDDFVTESSDEAMLEELVYFCACVCENDWKMFVY